MSKPWSVSLGKYYARIVVGNMFDGLKVTRYSLYVPNTNDSLDLDILTPASGVRRLAHDQGVWGGYPPASLLKNRAISRSCHEPIGSSARWT